ncbi:eukaryotic translation initiation factor 4G-like isoform X1 [Gossypium arboreum]|uniref:eukaryotic translation initiation factor 4G-like isoform X1 n=1 Tax=Gossypium arboreum TaxID=29729 RepID=UPI00081977A5|nr:eukaryotic translation initiation factor 4G-like isoform X1 [Gossypium arboreum]XP_017636081.1 eukaryotic translation initiation factor 4G-like isoform X1 [Gossypium arboreum]XP_052879624.1 eukaryotic translation initiation factor 4G-like isoform X1 [Gossypium arboreum]
MSFNQSRSEKSEQQYRKSGRSASFNQQRSSSGVYSKGAGGGPAPSRSPSSSSSLSSNRSLKKSSNAQGGQYRLNSPVVSSTESSSSSAARTKPNGAHLQPQLLGASDALIAGNAAQPVQSHTIQNSTRPVSNAATSQPAAISSDTSFPSTSEKEDASKAFSLQFGSITPGFMNGMQVPARTSSAPPNLDEQKCNQARHHSSFKCVPNLPIPIPRQQLPRKDSVATEQSSSGEVYPVPKIKKDAQPSSVPPANQTQKPSPLNIPMTSMQMPFHHQPHVPIQYGGPNAQIQSQSVTASSMQMPMHISLAMGNGPQVQQQVFVAGLQALPLPPQGMMHQGGGLSFTPSIGGHLPPQLGNLGMGITPQYSQQQGGKFGVPRKTTPVKITHPDTHEELRLDKRTDTRADGGSSVPRPHSNMPIQSQPIPSFAAPHSINYYSNSYNTKSGFYLPPSSRPLASNQIAPNTQGPRFNNPGSQGHQNISFMNSAAAHGSLAVNKSVHLVRGSLESANVEPVHDAQNVMPFTNFGLTQVTVKPASVSAGEKFEDSSSSSILPSIEKAGALKPSTPASEVSSSEAQRDLDTFQESSAQQPKSGNESLTSESLPATAKHSGGVPVTNLDESQTSNCVSSASDSTSRESTLVLASNEGKRTEGLSRSNSIKNYQKKPGQEGQIQPPVQSTSTSNLATNPAECGVSSDGAVTEALEAKKALTSLAAIDVLSQSTRELPSINDALPSSLDPKTESKIESLNTVSSEVSGTGSKVDSFDIVQHAKIDGSSKLDEQPRSEISGTNEEEKHFPEEHLSSQLVPLKSTELKSDQYSASKVAATNNIVRTPGTEQRVHNEDLGGKVENAEATDSKDISTSRIADPTGIENSHVLMTFGSNPSSSASNSYEMTATKTVISAQQSAPVPTSDLLESISNYEGEGVLLPSSKDKHAPQLSRTKSTITSGKKKLKEILQKADAAGTTSDLYMAYKGPEEKKETVAPLASTEISSVGVNLKQASHEALQVDAIESEKITQSKAELDDWEDAADISTPNMETLDTDEQAHGGLASHEEDGSGNIKKKYSRDFLLKFAGQYTDLPQGFDIASDIAAALMASNVNASHAVDRDSYLSPGRKLDRQSSGSRLDRRASGIVDDDRWIRPPGSFGPGRDPRLDLGYGAVAGFRPVQGGNFGVLRHPRAQTPLPYLGGVPAGPMPHMSPHGGMQHGGPDADRWHRGVMYQQKGLIPSPQSPLQTMHRAERKYQVGKVADEEEAKQRQLKGILNKLTPQNFEKLFEQVKAVNIDNAGTLTGVISQIFDKALMEPTFCEMYANFCQCLAGELPDFIEDNEKITFKRLLLNKCQEEFERGEREQEEANKIEEEGEAKLSEEEREEKRIKARRRMLGNIRLIGELYKKKMLTERIMHECIKKLLGEYENPDEEDVEALCKLMSTIGEMIDHPKAKVHMDAYFEMMAKLSNNMKLSSRIRFMLKDAIDLRKNKWQQRRKVEGPKKIEEVHRDAAQERQAQSSRLARGPGFNAATKRAAMDFSARGSMLSSPGSQMGSFRGLQGQPHSFGAQDVRMDDRQSLESRTLSVPLPQRPTGDDSITLGPQGGLGRGMSFRGPPVMSSTPLANISSISGDSRTAGTNGFSSGSEQMTYGPREDLMARFGSDRSAPTGAYEQSSSQERGMHFGNRDTRTPDRSFARPLAASPSSQSQSSGFSQNIPPEKGCSEERLHDLSMEAIKEFYSARDEKEVALCIKDLNSSSFHPTMIALWVTDCFERKDIERDLLAKLLVNLTRSHDGVLSQAELVKGFESVLSTLEDAVNDAPKAPEFLGRIFGKMIVENVMSLKEIGRLIGEGGEEPGQLVEIGLGGDVMGSTLGMIKREKGESVLNEIRGSYCLRLEDFRPSHPNRSRILETFLYLAHSKV